MSSESIKLSTLSAEKNVEVAELTHGKSGYAADGSLNGASCGNSAGIGLWAALIALVILYFVFVLIIWAVRPKWVLKDRNDAGGKHGKGKRADTGCEDEEPCKDDLVGWKVAFLAALATIAAIIIFVLIALVIGGFGWGTFAAAKGK